MTYKESKYHSIAAYYDAHLAELRAFAVSRTGHVQTAEDLVQEVFKRLLTSDKMVSDITLPCLVYTALRNLITDHWRHRRAVVEFEHYIAASPTASRATSTESIYNAREIDRLLENGIARLSQSQQRIYRLNIFEGMPVSEISRTLHLNYKSTENHLGAARRAVRQYVRLRLAI